MFRLSFLVLPLLFTLVSNAQIRPIPYPHYGLQGDPSPQSPQTPQDPNAAQSMKIAQNLCQQVYSGRVFRYDFIFDNSFRVNHPEQIFRDQLREVLEAAGYCTTVQVAPQPKPTPNQLRPRFMDNDTPAKIVMTSSLGQQTTIDIKYGANGLVTDLTISDMAFPKIVVRTWNDVSVVLSRLQGTATMTAGAFNRGLVDMRPQVLQPIGNASALYVLKALEEAVYSGQARWTDAFPIRDDWKSFPTGEMQTWPAGRMVTVMNFADSMMRINDNTAMDHLIHLLGRSAVQDALTKGGMANPSLPFMRTDEIFKLKWGAPADWLQKYSAMSSDDKAAFLEGDLTKVPLSSVGHNGLSMFQPTYVREVEWSATTTDLCRVMQSFLIRHDSNVLKVLSANTGVIDAGPGKAAPYAAFKAGAEPGALSMTYLILDRRNQWGCVSAAWSNPARNVNSWILRDIMRKSLKVYDPDL